MSSDNQRHRGAHPADAKLFAPKNQGKLRQAVRDLSWLLSRDYAPTASLKLVGDHFMLKERQRLAVARAACSDRQRESREHNRLPLESIKGQKLLIDGFNIIVTLEAALSGGVLIRCRDGCMRDMSSVHGSYRSVAETEEAIRLISETLFGAEPASVVWLLDQPVSNSGRLAQRIREMAVDNNWPWSVEVVMNPDKDLRSSDQIVVTSDSNILDGVKGWINLGEILIAQRLTEAWIVDLRD
ncbi:MAG TPA: DUF434 domain-containing protein [Blastocatellia bacterium]|jgi:hypothetical protein|nr:DUF434 domain-containing protein [Blastocatellia bacterium]